MPKKIPLKDTPLSCVVERNQLIIRIGIGTLCFALEHGEDWSLLKQQYPNLQVSDPKELSKDVIRAMEREDEVGASPLSDFLDKMLKDAIEDGSLGVEFD